MKGYGGFVVFHCGWYRKRELWKKMLSWIKSGNIKPGYLSTPGYPAIGCVSGTLWSSLYIEAFGKIIGTNLWSGLRNL